MPLRIVISNSMTSWGGGENWSLTAADGLRRRGHDVVLVCQPGSAILERALSIEGLRTEAIRIRGDLNPLAVFRAASLFERQRTQVACCNLDREVRSIGVAARMKRVCFIRRRGSDYGFKNSLRYRLTYRHLVSGVIVNSDSTMNSILTRNPWLDRARIKRIYNGIDTASFRPDPAAGAAFRLSSGLDPEHFVVGIVGSLLPRKRHSTLFRACAVLARVHPGLRILVAGPAPGPGHRSAVELQAAEAGVSDRVVFTGPVSDLRGCFNSLDILCMPSENEGFGYAAAEAMSCGRPVIVSDASSLPEVVGSDGGLIFPLDDHAALASAIRSLIDDPAGRCALGRNARNRVESVFSIDRMIDGLEEYFTSKAAAG